MKNECLKKWKMKRILILRTRNEASLKAYLRIAFLVILLLSSCNTPEEPVIKPIEAAAWSKFSGKIISASSEYIFVMDSKTENIDTILTKPSYISYQIYGAFGMMASYNKDRIMYSVYGGVAPQWSRLFSMQTDGSDNRPLVSNSAPMLSASDENREGAIAYFTGSNYYEANTLWIDDKIMFDFTSSPYGSPYRYMLNWHPQENLLLMSLVDYKENYWTSSLYGMQLPNMDIKPILLAPAGSLYLSASYSIDGKKIVFLNIPKSYSNTYEGISICTVNSDGTGFKKVIDASFRSYPVWSPDGEKIAYTSYEGIHVANADGSEVSLVWRGYADRLIWLQE